MATLIAERTMFYCPKCQRKYNDGSQRFCNNDGGRLLPTINSGVKQKNEANGVFTNLLGRKPSSYENDERLAKAPRFVKTENKEPTFAKTVNNNIFKTEQELKPNIAKPISKPIDEPKKISVIEPINKPKQINEQRQFSVIEPVKEPFKTAKPVSQLNTPKETPSIQKELGREKSELMGKDVLISQKTQSLIGNTVKGRYHIVEQIEKDQTSVTYFAKDKINNDKKVIFRVFNQNDAKNDFQNKLLMEERVSLSNLNHPNVAKLFDSGEISAEKSFIVTEYVENETVTDFLNKTGVFNPMRAARIIRQASMALNEVHQNGILHRNLQPQHILLTVSEVGNESVKVTDFGVSDGNITPDNLIFKSPEQLNGQLPTFASDSYSLAIIAFQMLTKRLPFNGTTEIKELYKKQKDGLMLSVSDLNTDVNPLVDNILHKALSFNPADRYPKARDFGEAFFNALTTSSVWEETPKLAKPTVNNVVDKSSTKIENFLPKNILSDSSSEIKTEENADISFRPTNFSSDIHIDTSEFLDEEETINIDFDNRTLEKFDELEDFEEDSTDVVTNESLWEKRSPEPTKERGGLWSLLSIGGLIILAVGALLVWQYFSNIEEKPVAVSTETQTKEKDPTIVDVDSTNAANPVENLDVPPQERKIIPPKDFVYFENTKQNLKGELANNFRGFSLHYPKNWSTFESETNYFDAKLKDDEGFPKQQFIVTNYKSKGTFNLDKDSFPELVAKSNKDLKEILPNYETVSQGETTVNSWNAYQVTFKGKTDFENKSENFEIWGRRIWLPAARLGINNGFVITMLATSLSDKIEGVDDVGKKGELGEILNTFEPARNY